MTKEELDKEATEYALKWGDKTDGTYACCRDGYLAGAEPREKRIAEQEEQLNSTLEENKEIYKKMADLDTALEDCTESLTDARIKIKELEAQISILLSCKNCPDNKGGYICQKEYENKCLAQKIQYIKELQEEIAELKDKLNNLASVAKVRLANWQKYEKENAELKKQIEKMKRCQNCKFEDNDCIEEPCSACTRCLGDIKRKGDSDKWEIKE